jgi:hypothetical protein
LLPDFSSPLFVCFVGLFLPHSFVIRHSDFNISKIRVYSCAFVVKISNQLAGVCVCFAFLLGALDAIPTLVFADPSPTPNHIISRIPRQAVQSTAIAKVGYSKRRHILEIEFVNGAIYRYLDVPPSVYHELMSADSKARFYDSNIRGHYRSIPIRPRQKTANHE